MGIAFSKPPVNEVVAGQAFVPRADLLIPHLGEFWASRLKGQYPRVAHAVPVTSANEPPFCDPLTGVPLPRLWFIGQEETRMVQLQQDRIYANWRRLKVSDEYVRFPAVRDEFIRVLDEFNQYVEVTTGVRLKPVRYELTYVNMLRKGDEYGDVTDLSNVFRDFGWQPGARFLSHPSKLGARFEFALPNEFGTLTVAADPVRKNDTEEDLYRFQLAAVAPIEVAGRIDFAQWIEAAHDQIVRGFKDLTTSQMHAHWGLIPEEGQE